ncbi:hypothetical protein ACFYOK_00760 [Microbispora bryophytorum]|uniref:hypothetical protein n=1 Tax=Microbispora bryophytorum TaxID=1460882 RepID=UPI0033EEB166
MRSTAARKRYRAEGDPSIHIDVATNDFHPLVRLALRNIHSTGRMTGPLDVRTLLRPDAVRVLRDKLNTALGEA